MTNKTSSTPGDNYTSREQEALGKYTHLGLLRYKDLEAGYCLACERVYGVECPKCGSRAGDHLRADGDLFIVDHPIEPVKSDNHYWVPTHCAKCDFMFRVIVQTGVLG